MERYDEDLHIVEKILNPLETNLNMLSWPLKCLRTSRPMTIDELVSFQAREERLIRSTSGAIEKMLQAKLSISDK